MNDSPDTVEDEEELDEDAAEWKHSPHDDPREGAGVERLLRDLAGDLVGPHGMLYGLSTSHTWVIYTYITYTHGSFANVTHMKLHIALDVLIM